MKLQKALKYKKKLIGDINKLKQEITTYNSFTVGNEKLVEDFLIKNNVKPIYDKYIEAVNKLINLKCQINKANEKIQHLIFELSEIKSLISFWETLNVNEGEQPVGYDGVNYRTYYCSYNKDDKKNMISELQSKIDAIQEEIDTHNYTTEIPFEE